MAFHLTLRNDINSTPISGGHLLSAREIYSIIQANGIRIETTLQSHSNAI